MKTVIILLLFSFNLFGQAYKPISMNERRNNSLKITGLFITSIALNAMGDAYNNENQKTLGHTLNAGSILTLLSIPLLTNVKKDKWIWYLASYTSLRIGMFDPIYNKTRGLPFNYVGNSSISDKILGKAKSPDGLGYLGRGAFFTVGFFIPLNQL